MALPTLPDFAAWVTQIQSQCPAILYAGKAASNMDAIDQGPKVSCAAYVLEPQYSRIGTPGFSGSTISQMLNFQVGVIIAVQEFADPTGQLASGASYTARNQVFGALVGWKPDPNGFTIEAGTGKLLQYKNGFWYYLDTYQQQVNVRNQ